MAPLPHRSPVEKSFLFSFGITLRTVLLFELGNMVSKVSPIGFPR